MAIAGSFLALRDNQEAQTTVENLSELDKDEQPTQEM